MNRAASDIPASTTASLRRLGLGISVIFWAVQFSEITALTFLTNWHNPHDLVLPRVVVLCAGLVLTAILIEIVLAVRDLKTGKRLAVAAAAAVAACLIHAGMNLAIFRLFVPLEPVRVEVYLDQVFTWGWFFVSITAVVMALAFSFEVRDRERRLAEVSILAQSAQLRALRYQLNPHFLFNTLNSIAALIADEEPARAEQMLENLSDFLRSGLELDPQEDIPLATEVELQSLYLGIEEIRFPERLKATINLPDALRAALVPGLITQPLVENAIKHGVARSTAPVLVTISAGEVGGRLKIEVANTAPRNGKALPQPGAGVGLENVRGRLEARFGADFTLEAGPMSDGGFAVRMDVPLLMQK